MEIGDFVTGTREFYEIYNVDEFVAQITNITTQLQFGDYIYYELDKDIEGTDDDTKKIIHTNLIPEEYVRKLSVKEVRELKLKNLKI